MLAGIKRWRFLLALIGAMMPIAGYLRGDNYHAFLVAFGIVPVLDWLIGSDRSDPAPGEMRSLEAEPLFRGVLYAYVPIHLWLIGWGAAVVASGELPPAQNLGLALSVGVVTGAQGITIAHELGHGRAAIDRWLARLLLVTVSYGHFYIEHNRGHHLRVATPADPATARYGEGFWAFLPRTLAGSWLGAWRLEARRLHRLHLSLWNWRNQMLWFTALPCAIAAGLGYAFGPLAVLFFCVQSAMAMTLLEAVNYVEHYGLLRVRLPDGRYEPFDHRHAWDSSNFLTNCFLVQLQRHSDHHLHPARPYQALHHSDASPQLPNGYAGMIPLALIPPLWFAVMNPRTRKYQDAHSIQPQAIQTGHG